MPLRMEWEWDCGCKRDANANSVNCVNANITSNAKCLRACELESVYTISRAYSMPTCAGVCMFGHIHVQG